MTTERRILLIVNPAAGKSDYQPKLNAAYALLEANNIPFTTFFTEKTEPTGKLKAIFVGNNAINEIWVIGGDGTLNYVVNECGGRRVPIVVVSGGTGNDSVKSIHGITDFREQLNIALHGRLKAFDLGICNKRLFVNGVGIGFDGKVVEKMVEKGRKRGSHLSYMFTVIQLLAGYREQRLQCTIDGRAFEDDVFLMTISNGTTFGGGFVLNPLALADDGLLDVCVIRRINVPKRFIHMPKLRTGSHTVLKETEFFRGSEVIVQPHPSLVAHRDGEFIGNPPFTIRLSERKFLTRIPS